MKKSITNMFLLLVALLTISNKVTAQLKVIQNGSVAIGINYPNYPFHVYGWGQLFNYNGMEIKFRANNGFQSDIGSSNSGVLNFWNANCWSSGGWNKLKANQFYTVSDQRLKRDVTPLINSMSVINQLRPKKYYFIDSIQTAESSRLHYGFLAQDVFNVLPDLVDTSRGTFALDYIGLIPFLVDAIKEQSSTIDSLKNALSSNPAARNGASTNNDDSLLKEIENLKEKIQYIQDNCCKNSANNSNPSGITLNNHPSTVLNINNDLLVNSNDVLLQNVPNPFDNNTTIKFNIPEQYHGKFYLKIYTINGEEKMSYSIDKKDKQITVGSSTLSSGIYLYALIVNNDVLSIKQMVVTK